ncbi:transcriptional regulator [Shinella sp. SUS2]|uniref:LysR substrate-binding domain-containing protein n=1 Tax=unclassified Shinella TaxID=2643062 RepID=UPI00068023AA|nr:MULTISPECIES: LysR substrate-binding domain-containing protein [unclassified Shinella]KNY13008.1 transcriptional regulator [Shinella sp. SUS2]KOC71740.1 transcriptional regulator [Shinella sp. GWS1]MDG4676228.1 LysR substrate-binding domain-containing protein [Shinella sp. 838]
MPPPLDLDLLKTFVAVAETGSFSSAAPRIGRSQSAVSMQMQRLEQAVGKRLLVRGSKAVIPNAVGAELLVHARRLLKLSDQAWASVAQPNEIGCVRLGVPDDYAAFLLPPVLERFAADYPLVTLELVCEPSASLSRALDERRIDLAIITRLPNQPVEILRREPFVWVAAPSHVVWQDDPLPVALFEAGCAARTNVLDALAVDGRAYRCAYSSASLLGLIAVVQAGLAIAGLALCSVPPSLRIIDPNEGLPPLRDLEIGLLQSSTSTGRAVDRLADFLRRALRHNP